MYRAATVTVAGLVLAASGALGVAKGQEDENTAVVAAAPVVSGDIASQVAALEARVESQPRDGRTWATLAHAYVELARLNGDPTNYIRSREALDRALALDARDDLALAGEAALAAAKHHFSQALIGARAALQINPYQSVALAIQVDALTELGRYTEQEHALAVADARSPGSAVLTRRSYAFELRGKLADAAMMLRQALGLARTPSDRAYVLTQIAELDRKSGRLEAAQRHLLQARDEDSTYVPAWASQARLEVARGDLATAETWWRRVATTSPNFDSSLELAELLLVTGRSAEAEEQLTIAAEIVADEAARGVHGDLEIAQLEADHGSPGRALAAARVEWSRRHSVHVADALAWALHRNGRSAAALEYAVAATRLGTPDAQFWLHRGLIEAALGEDAAARQHLGYGLQVDAGVRPGLAAEAQVALERM
jgi:tetratricopeptide (TPR) repeat protein